MLFESYLACARSQKKGADVEKSANAITASPSSDLEGEQFRSWAADMSIRFRHSKTMLCEAVGGVVDVV